MLLLQTEKGANSEKSIVFFFIGKIYVTYIAQDGETLKVWQVALIW